MDLLFAGLRGRGGAGGNSFQQNYRCHSVAMLGKAHLEGGGKIVLPPSALERLASLNIEYPMLFELQNPSNGRKTHAGVLEFVAEEGVCHIPYWMMQHLLMSEGQYLQVRSAQIPRGHFVKLQAHSSDFLDVSNPRVVLEKALRHFATLTTGEVIMIQYNDKNFYFNVLEVKPDGPTRAISVIETDLEVDFAAPLDYKEPESPIATGQEPTLANGKEEAQGEENETDPNTFMAFSGSGQRLDGKEAPAAKPLPISRGPSSSRTSGSTPPANSAPAISPQPTGLRFGGRLRKKKETSEENGDNGSSASSSNTSATSGSSGFVPFGGKGYSLRG